MNTAGAILAVGREHNAQSQGRQEFTVANCDLNHYMHLTALLKSAGTAKIINETIFVQTRTERHGHLWPGLGGESEHDCVGTAPGLSKYSLLRRRWRMCWHHCITNYRQIHDLE